MNRNYYQTLGISPSAGRKTINEAYRKLSLENHPERNKNMFFQSGFFYELAEAYHVLSDKKRRAIYDQHGEHGLKNGIKIGDDRWTEPYIFHGDSQRVFREFFGVENIHTAISEEAERNVRLLSTGFDDRSRKKNGEAIVRDLLLSLEECYFGAVKKMVIGESSKVGNSKGNVREKILSITVKPGWMPGSRVTFSGAWDQNPNEKPSDVIFVIKDKPHPIFSRDKSDLIYKTQIDLGHALTGLVLHIPHIDGRKLDIPITEIVRPGFEKRLPNMGMPLMSNPEKFGDLIIQFDVQFPKSLLSEQKMLIREALLTDSPHRTKTFNKNQ